ncbi:hypothetical protein N665_0489s0007 [Sinapis alba]|nr:hypothetical protein N665_0489s0007 [Sinapis alba]
MNRLNREAHTKVAQKPIIRVYGSTSLYHSYKEASRVKANHSHSVSKREKDILLNAPDCSTAEDENSLKICHHR